ncbi:unnamed protein product [Linum trigynum]|uniref:Uncharacterized protein n=1 Tax=Linum trigynum TaxID=586398 RepID=A0AAV2DLZ9_9ROSI
MPAVTSPLAGGGHDVTMQEESVTGQRRPPIGHRTLKGNVKLNNPKRERSQLWRFRVNLACRLDSRGSRALKDNGATRQRMQEPRLGARERGQHVDSSVTRSAQRCGILRTQIQRTYLQGCGRMG